MKVTRSKTVIGANKKLWEKIESEQCYHNALIVIGTYYAADIEYVEGEVFIEGEWVLHVWNYYESKYFDLTYEKHLPQFLTAPRRVLRQGTVTELTRQGYSFTPFFLPLSQQVFN